MIRRGDKFGQGKADNLVLQRGNVEFLCEIRTYIETVYLFGELA